MPLAALTRAVRVLVAGASGFIGLSAVSALSVAGHEVVGLSRSPDKDELIRGAGGTPVRGDILSIPTLVDAAKGCDALVHAAAAATTASREVGQSVAAKVRVDGTYNLVAASRNVGARRLLVVSGTWLIGDRKEMITEAAPVKPTGTAMFNWQAERAAMDANKPGGLEVVVVRPGMVYGDGSWFRELVEEIRAGTYRVPGDGSNHWSPLHIDDCGEAVRTVLEKGKAGEIYLAADDEPIALRSFVDLVADALHVLHPAPRTPEEAIKFHGDATAKHLAANQVASAAKLKALGWAPRVKSSRTGVPQVIAAATRGH